LLHSRPASVELLRSVLDKVDATVITPPTLWSTLVLSLSHASPHIASASYRLLSMGVYDRAMRADISAEEANEDLERERVTREATSAEERGESRLEDDERQSRREARGRAARQAWEKANMARKMSKLLPITITSLMESRIGANVRFSKSLSTATLTSSPSGDHLIEPAAAAAAAAAVAVPSVKAAIANKDKAVKKRMFRRRLQNKASSSDAKVKTSNEHFALPLRAYILTWGVVLDALTQSNEDDKQLSEDKKVRLTPPLLHRCIVFFCLILFSQFICFNRQQSSIGYVIWIWYHPYLMN
jgi:hypothetical protein